MHRQFILVMDFWLRMQISLNVLNNQASHSLAHPATIRLMGNKVAAIEAMRAANVPTVPGSNGPLGDDDART